MSRGVAAGVGPPVSGTCADDDAGEPAVPFRGVVVGAAVHRAPAKRSRTPGRWQESRTKFDQGKPSRAPLSTGKTAATARGLDITDGRQHRSQKCAASTRLSHSRTIRK